MARGTRVRLNELLGATAPPQQDSVLALPEKVGTFTVTASSDAAVRATDNIAIDVVEFTHDVAAGKPWHVKHLRILVAILPNGVGRAPGRSRLVPRNELSDE